MRDEDTTTTNHDDHPIPALFAIGPDAFRAVLALERLAARDEMIPHLADTLSGWLIGYKGAVAEFARNALASEEFEATREAAQDVAYAMRLGFWRGDMPLVIDPADPLRAVAYTMFRLLGPERTGEMFDRFERETMIVRGLALTADPDSRAEMIREYADALEALERGPEKRCA